MRFSRGIISAALAIGLGALGVTPAWAATNPILTDSSFDAAGLIVKYAPGVSAKAPDGQPTGENAAGVDLSLGRDIGEGWHSVSFGSDLTAGNATQIALRIASDPRVQAVELDRRLEPASVPQRLAAAPATFKAASPVLSVKATDAWSSAKAAVAAVKLAWRAPGTLFGGAISGYRVQINDGTGWQTKLTSLTPTAVITDGLAAGRQYSFRVAAITKAGSTQKLGAYSTAVAVTPTSVPQPPVFTGPNTAFGNTFPKWAPQNLAQSGGLPILGYTAVATATGQPSVNCDAPATATTCAFTGLVANVTYSVTVSARNSHGSTASLPSVTPLDALFKQQWYLTSNYGINAPNAWSKTMGSKSVVVAVIDSGITAHPDLDNQVIPGYDFVSDITSSNDGDGWDANNADPGDFSGSDPSSWHGTHVAGLIAAQSNTIGITGVAPNVKLQPIRALGSDGGKSSDLIAALRWAAGLHVDGVPDNKTPAQVVNLSMGTDSSTPCRLPGQTVGATEEALAELKKAGVIVISAAGNFNMPAAASYPGNCYPTINVGATAFSGERASYSNFSTLDSTGQMVGVDISAPGGDSKFPGDSPAGTDGKIVSTMNDGKTAPGNPIYAGEEGTSMAAPLVAGVVALILSVKPKLTFDQVWEALQKTVTKFPTGSVCDTQKICGAGIVNAGAAVAYAAAMP